MDHISAWRKGLNISKNWLDDILTNTRKTQSSLTVK
jgi:hypothetical protein